MQALPYLFSILLASMFCNGIYLAMKPNMLLNPMKVFVANNFNYYLAKPLVVCIICFSSTWGYWSFVFFLHLFTEQSMKSLMAEAILFIPVIAYLNYAIYND